jgi:hypothetical protein
MNEPNVQGKSADVKGILPVQFQQAQRKFAQLRNAYLYYG